MDTIYKIILDLSLPLCLSFQSKLAAKTLRINRQERLQSAFEEGTFSLVYLYFLYKLGNLDENISVTKE